MSPVSQPYYSPSLNHSTDQQHNYHSQPAFHPSVLSGHSHHLPNKHFRHAQVMLPHPHSSVAMPPDNHLPYSRPVACLQRSGGHQGSGLATCSLGTLANACTDIFRPNLSSDEGHLQVSCLRPNLTCHGDSRHLQLPAKPTTSHNNLLTCMATGRPIQQQQDLHEIYTTQIPHQASGQIHQLPGTPNSPALPQHSNFSQLVAPNAGPCLLNDCQHPARQYSTWQQDSSYTASNCFMACREGAETLFPPTTSTPTSCDQVGPATGQNWPTIRAPTSCAGNNRAGLIGTSGSAGQFASFSASPSPHLRRAGTSSSSSLRSGESRASWNRSLDNDSDNRPVVPLAQINLCSATSGLPGCTKSSRHMTPRSSVSRSRSTARNQLSESRQTQMLPLPKSKSGQQEPIDSSLLHVTYKTNNGMASLPPAMNVNCEGPLKRHKPPDLNGSHSHTVSCAVEESISRISPAINQTETTHLRPEAIGKGRDLSPSFGCLGGRECGHGSGGEACRDSGISSSSCSKDSSLASPLGDCGLRSVEAGNDSHHTLSDLHRPTPTSTWSYESQQAIEQSHQESSSSFEPDELMPIGTEIDKADSNEDSRFLDAQNASCADSIAEGGDNTTSISGVSSLPQLCQVAGQQRISSSLKQKARELFAAVRSREDSLGRAQQPDRGLMSPRATTSRTSAAAETLGIVASQRGNGRGSRLPMLSASLSASSFPVAELFLESQESLPNQRTTNSGPASHTGLLKSQTLANAIRARGFRSKQQSLSQEDAISSEDIREDANSPTEADSPVLQQMTFSDTQTVTCNGEQVKTKLSSHISLSSSPSLASASTFTSNLIAPGNSTESDEFHPFGRQSDHMDPAGKSLDSDVPLVSLKERLCQQYKEDREPVEASACVSNSAGLSSSLEREASDKTPYDNRIERPTRKLEEKLSAESCAIEEPMQTSSNPKALLKKNDFR
ncbi:unnamed protein product [Protopolystoma xenopodis]|uniref:Uncharacterized protein n=1 Tax=Protopolystoma xenopodis TaxID=117903 RepID=A0A3S5AW00_9PLAT|nr:unnamed protein product [Protopolystoma xenopodis]